MHGSPNHRSIKVASPGIGSIDDGVFLLEVCQVLATDVYRPATEIARHSQEFPQHHHIRFVYHGGIQCCQINQSRFFRIIDLWGEGSQFSQPGSGNIFYPNIFTPNNYYGNMSTVGKDIRFFHPFIDKNKILLRASVFQIPDNNICVKFTHLFPYSYSKQFNL